MNYLVCIKQVPDTTTRFQLTKEGLDLSHVQWVINPYDELAVEEALRFCEKDELSRVEVLTLGPARAKTALHTALAMGVHEAIHIKTDQDPDSLSTAQAIYDVVKNKSIDVIFCGKQSIDQGNSSVGPMLAALLGWPSISPVNRIIKKENKFEVHRPLGGGVVEILSVEKPLVVCVTKGINEPRYPSLPGIMKAKSKPLHTLSTNIQSYISVSALEYPKTRPPVQMIEGQPKEQAQKLVQILREKEKIIS